MAEVLTVTNIRKNLLREIEHLKQKKEIILTKDYTPVAVLSHIDIHKTQKQSPAMIVLGAKKCFDTCALKTINVINYICKKYYSKVIFVYGNATKKYRSNFKTDDLRTVYNKKSNLPIITSLKCGITALSLFDKYFVIVFLSQPQDKKTLMTMSNAALKSSDKIIISRRNGKPVHPIAFSANCKNILIKTRKELGIPHIIKKFKDKIMYVDIKRRPK